MKWSWLFFITGLLLAETPDALIDAARAEGLPTGALAERLREGRVKAVPEDQIQAALIRRAGLLRESRGWLEEAGYPLHAPPVRELWEALARVREGGMTAEEVQAVLRAAGGASAGRLPAVFEAGESLRLGGVPPPDCQQLMLDFTSRGLNRMEILRASRTARQLAAAGLSGEALRQALWGSGFETERSRGRGEGNGPGPGHGRGR